MNSITNKQKMEMLLKDYLDYKDIGVWFGKKKSWAQERLKEYKIRAIKENKKTITGYISTKAFIEYEEIDFEEIYRKAKIEQELGL